MHTQIPEAGCLSGRADSWQVPKNTQWGFLLQWVATEPWVPGPFIQWDGLSLGLCLPVRIQVSLALGL